ncbi:MAG: HNH endonuclease [Sedimentisphaerales bacterium]|nr:HNH endonuclease [Sedimentisphaerales bacterium]
MLNSHKWHITGSDRNFYANRYLGRINGKKKFISMHRFIMNPPTYHIVDHVDGRGLNNTRGNLRIATAAQNNYNCRKTYKKTYSQYKGVCYHSSRNKFRADIRYLCKRRFLGHFDNEIDAAKAYDKAAAELFGQFANLNFPKDGSPQNNDLYSRVLSSRIEQFIDYISNLLGGD